MISRSPALEDYAALQQKIKELESRISRIEEDHQPRTPAPGRKNVFDLHKEAGGLLPLNVRRNSWSRPESSFRIDEIEPKGKYGIARGYFCRYGEPTGEKQDLTCAGCYQWEIA